MIRRDMPHLDAELTELNKAVAEALAKRKAWMDAHMADYSYLLVGDPIYDVKTGRKLGIVTELYRYWGGRDDRYDTNMNIEYRYREPGDRNVINNTSSQIGMWFGSRDDAEMAASCRLNSLKREA